jgi:PAS domain S-box-containing protein
VSKKPVAETLDHKQAQEELSIVYEALSSSVSGVIITNLEGNITYVNPAFLRIFDYHDKTEILGKNAADLFAADEVAKFSDVQTIIDETTGETEEFEAHRKDGAAFPVEVSSSNVTDHTGKIVGRMASFVDISEKKNAERELQKTNEELRSFVRLVSHDLKNPIIAIQGFSSRLLRKYSQILDERALTYLAHIKTNAARMQLLVNDLLALSKIEEVAPAFCDVSSAGIIHDVVSHLQDRMEERGILLVLPKKLPVISCNADRMYHVFENLLSNAIKFSRNTDRPKIQIGYRDRGDHHEFFVKDNGIGMDPQHHRKVFEMFHRLGEVEDKEGTGLGLAIVERIVKSHGGKVWIKSKKGSGATVYFSLRKDPESALDA